MTLGRVRHGLVLVITLVVGVATGIRGRHVIRVRLGWLRRARAEVLLKVDGGGLVVGA